MARMLWVKKTTEIENQRNLKNPRNKINTSRKHKYELYMNEERTNQLSGLYTKIEVVIREDYPVVEIVEKEVEIKSSHKIEFTLEEGAVPPGLWKIEFKVFDLLGELITWESHHEDFDVE